MRYYNSSFHLLDLCIFSYHLHAQTLIWPMDPFFEQMELTGSDRRRVFMEKVRFKTANKTSNRTDLHGPGSCQGSPSSGWPSNESLEPIISKYKRIYPWHPSLTRPSGTTDPWVVYNAPSQITDSINVVRMVQYDTNNGPYPGTRPTFQVDTIHDSRPQNLSSLPNATGLLYCFEGGTGAIDDGTQTQTQKQFPLWSMMGFVLARTVTDVELNLSTDVQNPKPVSYDIYIVFRGSRSGKLRLWEAAYKEEGNPDWVTNWDLTQVIEDREISARGKVCRGFGTSIRTMLPTVVKAMEEIANQKQQPPRYIYVTAHSLGGALACHFTSAVLCGTKYGPKGTGGQMPDSLKKWPWESVKLVTYSSPVVGDNEFRDNFNKTVQSRRIWLDGDYVTQEQVNCLVGEPYRISVHHEQTLQEKKVGPQQISHHPYLIRRNLILSWRKAGDDKGKIPDVLPDIPAGTGTEHYEEPMKYFKHCADVLGHLVTIKAARPGAHPAIKELFALSELFPDFSEHFRLYLEIFREWEPDLSTTSNAKGNKLQWLMSNLGTLTGGTSKDTLESYWKTAKDIQSDEAFFNFIGLCLFLTKLSLSKGSHSTADLSTVMPFIGAEASGDYSDLLKNKI